MVTHGRMIRLSHLPELVRSVRREWRYYLLLLALFVISFTIPILFALHMSGGLRESSTAQPAAETEAPAAVAEPTPLPAPERSAQPPSDKGTGQEPQGDTFAAVPAGGEGAYLKIAAAPGLTAQADSDFAVLVWLKPRRLPGTGEGMVLLSKIDAEKKNRPGYQILLTRDSAGLRPQVYWRSEGRLGGMYNFSELRVELNRWIGFVMSVRRGRYLGLHLIEYPEGIENLSAAQVSLLGGYDLGRTIIAESRADLIVGSFGKNSFRGAIGPVGVVRGEDLSGTLRELLEQIARTPRDPTAVFRRAALQVWSIDGKSDLSANNLAVSVVQEEG